MCEPTSLAIAGLAIGAVSAGVSAYGSYQQVQSANRAADYNAKVADYEAQDAEARGRIDAKAKRLEVARMISSQRAGYSGSGVVVDDGSALAVTQDTAHFGELDALAIKQNAARGAWGYKNQANLSRLSRSSALLAGGTSLLTSGSALTNQAYNYRRNAG